MTSPCPNCDPAAQCYLDDEQLAEIHGIEVDELPFAMRRGDVPMPAAQTIHGRPLWRTKALPGGSK